MSKWIEKAPFSVTMNMRYTMSKEFKGFEDNDLVPDDGQELGEATLGTQENMSIISKKEIVRPSTPIEFEGGFDPEIDIPDEDFLAAWENEGGKVLE